MGLGSAESGSATRPYAGPAERGPCQGADGCKLRSVCNCGCEAVTLSAPTAINCDVSCSNNNICTGYTLICDLATQTCGAIPPAK